MPGKGAATFASIVQDLEARYAGRKSKAGHGYNEGDGFIVDDVRQISIDLSTEVDPPIFHPLLPSNANFVGGR